MALLDGLSNITGAYSAHRALINTFAGTYYTGGTWANHTGVTARDWVQGTSGLRPTASTAGPNSIACLDFDGTDDYLSSAIMSSFMSNSAGYAAFCFMVDAISTNGANTYDNDALWHVSGSWAGVYLKSGGPAAYAFNWDGSDDNVSATIATGTVYVFEWKHTGGNLSRRLSTLSGLGSWSSVASGNTSNVSQVMFLGASSAEYFDGKMFEAVFSSVAQSSTDEDAIVNGLISPHLTASIVPKVHHLKLQGIM